MPESEKPINPEGSKIDILKGELMQIERQVMELKKHPSADSEQEIERLYERQKEILDELQRLADTK